MSRKEKKFKTSHKILIAVLCVVLFLLILVLIGLLYINGKLNLMNQVDPTEATMNQQQMQAYIDQNKETTEPDFTGEVINPEDIIWDEVDTSLVEGKDVINILLVGQDCRPGETRSRSDTMILCSFNIEKKEFTMTSFMRDMYVQIPGWSSYKMNAAYAWGGMDLINKTIEKNFGIKVDGNFTVDFAAFESVIDELGGVTIDLTATEARYVGNWNYQDPNHFTEGPTLLNGKDALTYARARSIGNADFDRTGRQRKVLTAIFESCKDLDIMELLDLMDTILPMLTTNLDNATIMAYAWKILPMASSIDLDASLRIPADGAYSFAWVDEMSVIMPNFSENRQLLLETIYGE